MDQEDMFDAVSAVARPTGDPQPETQAMDDDPHSAHSPEAERPRHTHAMPSAGGDPKR